MPNSKLLTHFTVIDRAGNRHVYDANAGWEYKSQMPHIDRIDVYKKDSCEHHAYYASAAVLWTAEEPTTTHYAAPAAQAREEQLRQRLICAALTGYVTTTAHYPDSIARSAIATADAVLRVLKEG